MSTIEQKRKDLNLKTKKLADNISQIKKRIVVFSGKGGVGKTTVSVNILMVCKRMVLKPEFLMLILQGLMFLK